jgi:hypothetical protein
MKTFVCAMVATLCVVGFVMAEDFNLQITKIDGDSVTGTKLAGFGGKGGKGGKGAKGGKGEEFTGKLAKGVGVYKGKAEFADMALTYSKEGDDLGIAGLKAAMTSAENGSVTVDGKGLTSTDTLELCVKDGKPCAKLNGKDVEFEKVKVAGKAPLTTHVTTDDSGNITTVLIMPAGGGFGGGKKGKGGN